MSSARRALRIGLAAGLVAAAASADYRQSYLDGRRALLAGRPLEAIPLLESAITERPGELERARLVGAIPEPYLPHHLLALAYYAERRCADALREWDISASQGALGRVAAANAEAGARRRDCAGLRDAEQAMALAEEAQRRVQAVANDRPWSAEQAASRRAAELDLEAARRGVEKARLTWRFDGIAAATERASRAGAALAALVATPAPPSPSPSGAGPAIAPSPGPEAATLPAASPTAAVPAAKSPGPEPAALALQAYFDGRYQAALELAASGDAEPERRERFLRALVRGAARYALYLLGGERDPAALAAARADLVAARREWPGFAPSPRDFSPRFIALYEELRAGGSAGSR